MKILVSGSTGFIGAALVDFLQTSGHQVVCLVRRKDDHKEDTIWWAPEDNYVEPFALEGFDAVIHLSGENLASKKWTDKQKERILKSRVQSTKILANALSQLSKRPRVFICASAIGFYGDHGEDICTEKTKSGAGFLAEVCREWENATIAARAAGIRTLSVRSGVVLSKEGGALAKMLMPFKLGLGGPLGNGKSYMSWIAIDDLLAIFLFLLLNERLAGPINAVSPNPVTNAVFTKTLGTVLHRPAFLRVPASVLRLLFGKELADEMLLSSLRVLPQRLLEAGYSFLYPDLNPALKHLLGKEPCREMKN